MFVTISDVEWAVNPVIELSNNKLPRLEESVFKKLMKKFHNRFGSVIVSASE